MASIVRQRGVSIIVLDPAYDSLEPGVLEALKALIDREMNERARPLVAVDLSQTSFLDSALIGLLFSARQRTLHKNGRLALCGARAQCAEVLEVVKADQVVGIYGTREEAVRALEAFAASTASNP